MPRMLFVSSSGTDLACSKAFNEALGFTINLAFIAWGGPWCRSLGLRAVIPLKSGENG
jgi:hypothetical protein